MRTLLLLFSLVLAPFPSIADAELIAQYALKSCKNSAEEYYLIEFSIAHYGRIEDALVAKKVSRDVAKKKLSELSDFLDKKLHEMDEDAFALAKPYGETAKIVTEVWQAAKRKAILETINEMVGKEAPKELIQSSFLSKCSEAVLQITEGSVANERTRRDAFERRLEEIDRRDKERTATQREQERLRSIGRGLSILAPAPAAGAPSGRCNFEREEISGFNKICYYSCVRGVETTNIGNTQICPLTR